MTTTLHQTELEFEQAVVQFAHLLGWRVAGFRPARRKPTDEDDPDLWETPLKYDAKGWPDLTLVRERVVFAELKSSRGEIRDDQLAWIDDLIDAGVEAYCWRPSDWPVIEQILTRHGAPDG